MNMLLEILSFLIVCIAAALAIATLQDALLKAFGLPPFDPRALMSRLRKVPNVASARPVHVRSIDRYPHA